MKHYVLLKFTPGTDLDAVETFVRGVYDQLAETLDFLTNPKVYRSCVIRDTNMDIMATIELDCAEHLQTYLTHPLHVQMAQTLKDKIIGRQSFDHE